MSPGSPAADPAVADTGASAGRWLRVRHVTCYEYGERVEYAHHLAHLRPRDTAVQRAFDWQLTIDPLPEGGEDACWQGRDIWGNWRHGFTHAQVHDRLEVTSAFTTRLLAPPPLAPHESPPWETVARSLGYEAGRPMDDALEFALPSIFAPQSPALAALAADLFPPGRPVLEGALALMQRVHRRFEYRPASTDATTSALQALAQGRGVCQDFAHVMIGALRSLGLAARYVSGYLLTHPAPGRPRLVGADASHAWVAVWCPRHDWVALDPTNNVPVGLDHVTVAWGRDYADVAPLRGVIRGGGAASPQVAVSVEPIAAP